MNYEVSEQQIIEPEKSKLINVIQALEYLGMLWNPYKGNDERMVEPNRDDIRKGFNNGELINDTEYYTKEQLIYNEKVYLAISALESLLRNQKISILLPSEEIVYDNNGFYVDKTERQEDYNAIKEALHNCIDEVTIEFFSTPCIKITNLFGHIAYKNPSFKFDEIKSYKMNGNNYSKALITSKVINDSNYTTPLIQIVNIMIEKYGNKINRETKETVLGLIQKQEEVKGYTFSKNERMAIFKVIRKPETKIGGAKPQAPTPDL